MPTLVFLVTILPTPRGVSNPTSLILCQVDIIPRVGWTGIIIMLTPIKSTFSTLSIYPNPIKENGRMSTCNWLELQTLGSQLVMPKNLPGHKLGSLWRLIKSSIPFKRDLAPQNIPLSKQPFKTQPQIENEEVTWSPQYNLPATSTNKRRALSLQEVDLDGRFLILHVVLETCII